MHIGTMTWSSGPKHGATTGKHETLHRLRRRQRVGRKSWSKAGNVGWDGDWIQNRNAFSFTKTLSPTTTSRSWPDTPHAKGVKLIVHN